MLESPYAQNVGRRKQQMDDSAEMPIPKMTMKVTRNTTNLRSEANSRYGYATSIHWMVVPVNGGAYLAVSTFSR